jgi:alpha-galactosidase
MRFGLWFEPEMVNRDSDLFRAHPDYMLGPDDQPSGRNQHVLDMARPEVRAHLFAQIDAILSSHDIDYVKWDHNRPLTGGGPDQARGFTHCCRPGSRPPGCGFRKLRIGRRAHRLRGILARTTRVWLSDSNDGLERLRMQHEAARWMRAGNRRQRMSARASATPPAAFCRCL